MFFIKNIEEFISGICLSITLMCIITNVLLRFTFGFIIIWAEEVATIAFVWCVFIGASACYKRNMHIGVDFLIQLLPLKIKNFIQAIVYFVMIVINIYFTYISYIFAISAWGKLTPILRLPYTVVDIPVTIGFFMMSIHSFLFFIKYLKNGLSTELKI